MSRRVGVLFRSDGVNRAVRDVAAGIALQAEELGDCHFQLLEMNSTSVQWVSETDRAGLIVIGLLEEDLPVIHAVRRMGVPVVHAGELECMPALFEVRAPNALIGRIAARHLLECGFTQFAYVGQRAGNSFKRCEGFVSALTEAGVQDVPVWNCMDTANLADGLRDFLTGLPRPVGIMVGNDRAAWAVAQEAFCAGIAIPEQMAVIGVGNDSPWCLLAAPPLSSVELPGREIGRRALQMLDDLIAGRSTPESVDITSAHVVDRQSTAVMHAEQPEIAAAIRFIRKHFTEAITVLDVAERVSISRSTLEVGMKRVLGRTPLQEILRLRFDAAKHLLASGETPMKLIARRCGFTDSKHFSAAFRTATGMSPREYRNQLRPNSSS